MHKDKVLTLTEQEADDVADSDEVCHFCDEPFKEGDTIIPGVGVIVGEMDVVRYRGKHWHHGCVADWRKARK
jgi:hypothetical protein